MRLGCWLSLLVVAASAGARWLNRATFPSASGACPARELRGLAKLQLGPAAQRGKRVPQGRHVRWL